MTQLQAKLQEALDIARKEYSERHDQIHYDRRWASMHAYWRAQQNYMAVQPVH